MSLFSKKKIRSKWLIIFCLILAGEIIFGLPFHIVRFFRPTFLDVFNINNAQLGDAFAVYGVLAMISYFPSGILADRYSARKLITLSLLTTGIGGFVFMTIPGPGGLALLFGFWGITTILFLWSALLRATREWGGKLNQGKAFGLLDGGRGLLAAGAASIGVLLLSTLLPVETNATNPEEQRLALQLVIFYYSGLTLLGAFLVWFIIPDNQIKRDSGNQWIGIKSVFKQKTTWLQALIVICAYCGYKGLDYYALLGTEVLGLNEIEASSFVSNASYLRPIAAIGAGFLADKISTKRTLIFTFVLLISSYIILSFFKNIYSFEGIIVVNLLVTFSAVYALRGIYFALFEESNVPSQITGTTVGVVSLIGFTPDVFFNSLAGRIIDKSPGIEGFQQFYTMLLGFALIGLFATVFFNSGVKSTNTT